MAEKNETECKTVFGFGFRFSRRLKVGGGSYEAAKLELGGNSDVCWFVGDVLSGSCGDASCRETRS